MRFKRKLAEGDKVRCQGRTFMVKEILSQDFYICDWDDARSYVDIEFKDERGGYHHWKSNLDGGEVLYKDTNKVSSVLKEYHVFDSDVYEIPFECMSAEVTDALLSMMKRGYGLTAYVNNSRKMYALVNLEECCRRYSRVDSIKDYLYLLLHRFGCHFFVKMSIDEYFGSELYQKAIDNVLINGKSGVVSLLLVCTKDDYLEFIEANGLVI